MSRHVQNTDSSVLERRLRPIYDWLDSGNNKKALQECNKVLKKTPNLPCAEALKALTLCRMQKESESVAILDSLNIESTESPLDNATLQAMTLCYREMREMEKICKLYETAVKLDPTNEELHTHLFMSYVRVNDFKAQQQCAMTLYKQKPKNPYYCWNVMSIVLQATRGEGASNPDKKKLLLSLAERMMKKFIDDNKVDAEQEVQLYMLILDHLGKYEEIIALLEGPLGEKLQCSNLSHLKLDYFKKLKKWHQINVLCKAILNETFDFWNVWKDYIHSAIELSNITENGDNSLPVGESDTPDNSAEKCHEFICSVLEVGARNSFSLRGTYLARFELCLRLREKNMKTEEIFGDVIELFIEYFRKFGHKPCCVSDLRIYLKLLDCNQKLELAGKLVKELGIGPTSVPQSADQMQQHICVIQLARLCGYYRNLSGEHLRALVTAFILHYQHGSQAYGKGLLSTDLGPADYYGILAAHVLYDLSRGEEGNHNMVAALALLEGLLKHSPSNFHAKLLAVKLYHMIGDSMDANFVFHGLDVKHIQLDSLGYVHCGRLATTGQFSLCAMHFDTTLKFFSSNYRDSTDHLTFSYKFGSFMKLEEFMDFREKLNNSMHYTTVVVDRIILSLVDCSGVDSLYDLDISPKDDKIEWDKLVDNRDLKVYVNWDPEFADRSLEDSEEIRLLFEQDLRFLKMRTHILWTLHAGIEILKSMDGSRQKHIESLRALLKDWTELEEDARTNYSKPVPEDLIAYPAPSRLHGYLDTPYRQSISAVLEFFVSLSLDVKVEETCRDAKLQFESLVQTLEKKVISDSSDFREKRKGLELLVNHLEVLCVCCVLCIMCSELIKPQQQPQKKANKKKQPIDTKQKDLLNNLVGHLKRQINNYGLLLTRWSNSVVERDLEDLFDSLSLAENADSTSLVRKVVHSYAMSTKEMQGVVKNKLKLLETLLGGL
ncbi:phagocyte signaling-impaired protein [Anthonomus grandis grandis]|uniref:phagocyte signaling-impaired protein n=1 Tax=Anthonomus grandis grandis TaxID=2921223 RepID=UPI002165268D|nr:phagocyte signaling-impaired protein [Anthonomus grandis grandis]